MNLDTTKILVPACELFLLHRGSSAGDSTLKAESGRPGTRRMKQTSLAIPHSKRPRPCKPGLRGLRNLFSLRQNSRLSIHPPFILLPHSSMHFVVRRELQFLASPQSSKEPAVLLRTEEAGNGGRLGSAVDFCPSFPDFP